MDDDRYYLGPEELAYLREEWERLGRPRIPIRRYDSAELDDDAAYRRMEDSIAAEQQQRDDLRRAEAGYLSGR